MSKIAVPMADPTTYLDYNECLSLENAAKTPRNRLLIALLWRCGLRVNEAISLKIENVKLDYDDIENSVLLVVGKGGTKRRMPINIDLFQYLKEYIVGKEGFLFPSHSKSGHLSKQWVAKILRKTGKGIGIEHDKGGKRIHPHTLRHSFAIFLVKSGVPLAKIQQLLRHSSLSSTTYYLQFSKEELAKDYHEAFRKAKEV